MINIIFSIILASITTYIGIKGFLEFSEIVHSMEYVTKIQIFKLALLIAAFGILFFNTAIIIGITITEINYKWTIENIIGMFVFSILLGTLTFIASTYRIYMAVKDKDYLHKKYSKKNS